MAAGSGPTSKLNLNKRIAFPVAKTDTRSNQPAVGDGGTLPQFVTGASGGIASPLPPAPPNRSGPPLPPMATTGTPPRCNKPGTNASEEGTLILPSNEEMKDSVKTTLEELLMKTETSRQTEVRKRLDVMLQSWTDGKLSDGLTKKLYQLAQGMDAFNYCLVEFHTKCLNLACSSFILSQAIELTFFFHGTTNTYLVEVEIFQLMPRGCPFITPRLPLHSATVTM